uniref:Uncharacterized protein n=1 Tax=Arundo donax TaxID=35708 RepID=A0A0A9F1R1_ARUDO
MEQKPRYFRVHVQLTQSRDDQWSIAPERDLDHCTLLAASATATEISAAGDGGDANESAELGGLNDAVGEPSFCFFPHVFPGGLGMSGTDSRLAVRRCSLILRRMATCPDAAARSLEKPRRRSLWMLQSCPRTKNLRMP